MNRAFKGIWIPSEIWLCKELTIQEKIMLVEIDSLDNEEGCYASNAYFAEFFNISQTRVSLVIKSLKEKGFITSTIHYKEGTKQILKRVLNICRPPYPTKVKDPSLTNIKEPTQQKLKENNTTNKPKSNNTDITLIKTPYAEFVSMTEKEYISLVDKFGKTKADECIAILNNYKGSTGKKYKSDYMTMFSWVEKRYEQENELKQTSLTAQPHYINSTKKFLAERQSDPDNPLPFYEWPEHEEDYF